MFQAAGLLPGIFGSLDPNLLKQISGDPLAPLPDWAMAAQGPMADSPAVAPVSDDSVNDGINSVGRPLDLAASDADKRTKALKKLKREGKREAMLSLAAGLLSSRNFGEGLSKGLMAYMQARRDHSERMKPTPKSVGDGAYEMVVDPVTRESTYRRTPIADWKIEQTDYLYDRKERLDDRKYAARLEELGLKTGSSERIARLKVDAANGNAAAQRALQRELGYARIDVQREAEQGRNERHATRKPTKSEEMLGERARTATGKLERYGRIEALLDGGTTGAGAGILNAGKRAAAEWSGSDVGGVKVADLQTLKAEYRMMELEAAQIMQGQGQITESERKILQESVPNLETDPTAAKRVIEVLRNVAQRDMQNTPTQDGYRGGAPSKPDASSLKKKYGLE